ncbi:hypothetical protein [Curtobacterium sp. PhB78]|uniref:hypothetical protein n=1 Tax=Curtobacterium sp. PhB78 TaxID=2485102 RepID=UPI000F49843E|nr:hypothetical protein [Curtobacterium sp. PhB78]
MITWVVSPGATVRTASLKVFPVMRNEFVQIEEVDERHYGAEGERDTFVVHFFHAPSGEMVAPDWDATSCSVSVIRVTDATYRAAFAEARRIAAGGTSPTLFSVSLETAEPNGPGILRLFGTDLNMEGLELDLDSHAAKRKCSPSSSAATVLRTRDRDLERNF